jgi:hypothetical protein
MSATVMFPICTRLYPLSIARVNTNNLADLPENTRTTRTNVFQDSQASKELQPLNDFNTSQTLRRTA